MALYVRALRADEKSKLEGLLKGSDEDLGRRAEIVLLSAHHVGVCDISSRVNLHPINVRKWIHRFNRSGIKGLSPATSPGRPKLFTAQQREAIVRLATTDPHALGLEFDAWSLQRLQAHLIERGVVNEVSPETIRQQLLRAGLVSEERHWVPAP